MDDNFVGLLFFVPLSVVFLLLFFGVIGPKKLRNRMRKINKWFAYDAAILFPLDPYKPLPEAVKEGLKNFLPTRARLKSAFILFCFIIILTILGVVISIVTLAIHSN